MAGRPPPDPVFVLRGSDGPVNTVNFQDLPGIQMPILLSGCATGKIKLWNLKTRRAETTIEGHDGMGILWSDFVTGDAILSQGRDCQINLWQLAEGRNDIIRRIPYESIGFCQCTFLQQGDDQLIAVAGKEPSVVELYNVKSSMKVTTLTPKEGARALGMVMKIKLVLSAIDDRALLLAGYEDGSIALWDVMESKVIHKLKVHSDPVMSLDYSIPQQRGVSGSADETIVTWKLNEAELQIQHQTDITNPGISDIKIRKDDKILATAGWDSRIRVFGLKKLKALAILTYHRENVQCLSFSVQGVDGQGSLLAAGSKDRHISLWSLYNS
ncbi:guanine nucleotide-binding protein subunit beta-like protein 1 isoform X2 [Ptychodera flava]|uniref:guanine nucleotide-binding protein subunit beta-like protein 1 isoform X2 n=1 Tax=Ptychodera flava TaxID=63121 RepID=UPI00396A6485